MFSGEWAGLAPEAYWSERRFWSLENLGFVPYSCVTLEQIMFSFLPQLPHLKWVATISKWHLDAKHESKIPILKKCSQWWHSVYWATYGETSINDTFKSPLVKGRHEKPTCMCFQLCPILYNLMDCSLPRASDHGIHQARILKWVPWPPPGDLPDSGIKPAFLMSLPGKPRNPDGEDENAGQLDTSPRALAHVIRGSWFHCHFRRGCLPPK